MAKKLNPLVKKMNALLGRKLAAFQSGLIRGSTNSRVTGYVVSSDFKGLDHGPRQEMLAKFLETGLTKHELCDVGPIVTMTPAEASVKQAS